MNYNKREIIPVESTKQIWEDHWKRIAEIDRIYKRRIFFLIVGFVIPMVAVLLYLITQTIN